ncbi:hypothetical protein GWK47_013982 [Chionoecetes opilio]|uniref:Uncharacterized protein n=1 Tax=Chionoecetes opilio TaxID=41210 RepID=A0A8J4XV19_CHIOP|nr:hypothetical protein GWK47_013982 [Chionoecetes opilio]
MFHILETRPTKVRWCWLARERGTSTASPLVSTVLVLRVATLGGCRNPARCGTPCTCALWNTTSAATSLRCSVSREDSPARTGLVGLGVLGGLQHPPSQGSTLELSSLRVCEAAHDIRRGRRTLRQRPCGGLFCNVFDGAPSNLSSGSTSTPRTLTASWSGRGTPPNRSLPSTAGPAAGDRETPIACVFSGQSSPANVYPTPVYTQLLIDLISSTPTVMSRVGQERVQSSA